jgi:ATP-binding cassette, subfamily C, bacterial
MVQAKSPQSRYPGVFRIFFTTSPVRAFLVLAGLVLAGFAEMIGYATLLPVLTIAVGQGGSGQPSWLQETITRALTTLGIPTESLGVLLLVVMAAIVAKNLLMTWSSNFVGYEVADVATGLRLKLIDTLLRVRWSYFARQPVGRFANAVSNEASRAAEAYSATASLMANLVQAVVYVILTLLVSWQLGAIALVVSALISYALKPVVRMSRKAGRRQTQHTHDLVTRLTDTLIGIKPLKAMARQVRFGTLFAADARSVNKALRRQVWGKQAVRSGQEVMLWGIGCGLLYAAATFWKLPLQELIVMAALLFRTVLMFNRSQQWYQIAALSESAFWGLRETIAEAERERETSTGRGTPTFQSACSFDDVTFGYGDKTVLRNVSLIIKAGEITTLTGGSGAGKTTIADLLLGLHRPDSGEINIDDMPLGAADLVQWREMVGYVPQEVILFHDSVLANVTLGNPELGRDDAQAALAAAGAWDFVAQLPQGLESIVGERGTLLSGGQRQRIAVARALIHRPALLILDEATSALDPNTEAAICRNLKDLVAETGLTIVAITHQSAWVEAAHRVYHVERGQVREAPPIAAS